MQNRLTAEFGKVAIITVMLLVGAAAWTVPAAAYGYDDVSEPVVTPTIEADNTLEPGETTTLPIALQNQPDQSIELTGDVRDLQSVIQTQGIRLGSAGGTTVEFHAGEAPIEIKTGRRNVGDIRPRGKQMTSVTVEVDEDAAPGTYQVPVTMNYTYVDNVDAWVNDQGDTVVTAVDDYAIDRETVTVEKTITVEIEETAQLSIQEATGNGLYEQANGRIEVTVQNSGTEAARDATLNMVGTEYVQPRTNGVGLGTLQPGETATASFQAAVADADTPGQYATDFQLSYKDENGRARQSDVETGRVKIGNGPAYELSARSEALYVGSTGAVAVEVTNTGDRTATNARAKIASTGPFSPVSNSVSLGDLAPGESTTATYRLEVADQALPETYSVPVTVVHQDSYGNRVADDDESVDVAVGPETDFTVTDVAETEAGSTTTLTYTIRNTGGGTFTDAVARINTNSPFETDDDTAYVGTLEPNETTTVSFTVSTDGAATPKSYTLDMSVKYDNQFGETVVTDVQSAPVTVAESSGGFTVGAITGFAGGAGALVALLPLALMFGIAYRTDLLSRIR
ncbi:COG1361 S-layer family protein [Halorientalis brevis]|uniref:COG1361 S-layer family protein n=1 Tax=Halorientalis brevis TaxID=1126241 RepID=A0ABD6C713_9EURY|nr:CARDB domain-containing protein [Halorientalis brevis]